MTLPLARNRAFVIVEVMVAVAIFGIGVVTLGRCVDNCLRVELMRAEDQRARLVLENRMAEVEARAIPFNKALKQDLKGQYAGMTLRQKATALKLANENKEPIEGIFQVDLEVTWMSSGEEQAKSLQFYIYEPGRTF